MVELQVAPYDQEEIPFVHASIVSIDAELSTEVDDSTLTAHTIFSPTGSVVTQSTLTSTRSITMDPTAAEQAALQAYYFITNDAAGNSDQRQTTQQPQPQEHQEKGRAVASGAAGAVLGLLLGGPFLALVFGIGTAHYAKKDGAMGDIARALGDVAVLAREKAKEVDDKHHIVDKSKEAAKGTIEKLKETDHDHHVKERLCNFISHCWISALDFVQQHRLMERGSAKVKRLLDHVVEKMIENQDRVATEPRSRENERGRAGDVRQ